MRTRGSLAIDLPAELRRDIERVAKKERRTPEALAQDALRQYVTERRWEELRRYGRERAAALGIRASRDVVRLIAGDRKAQPKQHRRG